MAEWKVRLGALPVAFALALLFHGCGTGHFVQRTALTMPLHELGHAITAWWCGYAAVPTLWKTLIPESRGVVMPLLVGALSAGLVWRGWTTERLAVAGLGLGLAALLVAGTTMISEDTAAMAITFGGDAGAMILATLLVVLFFLGDEDSKHHAGGLRFGLLAIGAAALVDTFATWWTARRDTDAIPYGEIEGVGLSDPSKLQELHGWSDAQLAGRYVTVGALCLVACVVVWGVATWSGRRRA